MTTENLQSTIRSLQSLGLTAIVSFGLLGLLAGVQLIAFIWKIVPATVVHVGAVSERVVETAPMTRPVIEPQPVPPGARNSSTSDTQRATALVAEAEQAQRLGQWQTVIARVEEAVSIIGPNPQLLFQRAFAMERLGMEERALMELDKLRTMPNLDPVLVANIDKLTQRIRLTLANVSARGLRAPEAPITLATPSTSITSMAPAAPAANTTIEPDAKPLVDGFGLPPGAAIGLVDVRESVDDLQHRRLRIALKKRPDLQVEAPDVKVHVQFFERNSLGNIVPTNSQIRSEWISPPIDWADNEPEILDVIYHGPSTSEDDSQPNEYLGYLVGVYYGDELQDSRAQPSTLERKFPLPLFLKAEETR